MMLDCDYMLNKILDSRFSYINERTTETTRLRIHTIGHDYEFLGGLDSKYRLLCGAL